MEYMKSATPRKKPFVGTPQKMKNGEPWEILDAGRAAGGGGKTNRDLAGGSGAGHDDGWVGGGAWGGCGVSWTWCAVNGPDHRDADVWECTGRESNTTTRNEKGDQTRNPHPCRCLKSEPTWPTKASNNHLLKNLLTSPACIDLPMSAPL